MRIKEEEKHRIISPDDLKREHDVRFYPDVSVCRILVDPELFLNDYELDLTECTEMLYNDNPQMWVDIQFSVLRPNARVARTLEINGFDVLYVYSNNPYSVFRSIEHIRPFVLVTNIRKLLRHKGSFFRNYYPGCIKDICLEARDKHIGVMTNAQKDAARRYWGSKGSGDFTNKQRFTWKGKSVFNIRNRERNVF